MSVNGLRIVIVGGGAAGVFAAIAAKERQPAARVTLLEGSPALLSKVRISGGGRCNVTHNEPDPAAFILNYPRGGRALRGPLTRFGQRETVAWFAERGVRLKAEGDGRMFPVTDDSRTIIDCLLGAAAGAGVEIRARAPVTAVELGSQAPYSVLVRGGEVLPAGRVLIATGGAPAGHRWAEALGHTLVPPVPSIFTFNVEDERLGGLAGVSVPRARVRLEGSRAWYEGPLLVTHWGLSGPAVLRASAWEARTLHANDYRMRFSIDWCPQLNAEGVRAKLARVKEQEARRTVLASNPFALPQRLWRSLAAKAGAKEDTRWADASKRLLASLAREVSAGSYEVTGKGVFKEEFVTAGGVSLREIDFTTMESRVRPGLHFAGEVLDIDGVTGGFNFQSAWSTGWLAGRSLVR